MNRGTLARSAILATTLDQVQMEMGLPRLRREAEMNRSPRSRLRMRRSCKYAANNSPVAAEYVGVDVVENPAADLQGAVESLPVEDGSFDLVLCVQVLEHTDDPDNPHHRPRPRSLHRHHRA